MKKLKPSIHEFDLQDTTCPLRSTVKIKNKNQHEVILLTERIALNVSMIQLIELGLLFLKLGKNVEDSEEEVKHKWKATWRLDHEETFMTDSFVYELPTTDLVQAAIQIATESGGHNTLISLERVDV